MGNKQEQQIASKPQNTDPRYFEFLAEMGVTKHLGSMDATRELWKLCQIEPGNTVLDIGCGIGITPCQLAQQYGCHVIGIDITPGMIRQSRARAERFGVEDLTTFIVADARDIPFNDHAFDAVFTESVCIFFADKQQAIDEFVRVTRPGGYVGLNEATLLKQPPDIYLDQLFKQITGTPGKPPLVQNWTVLLKNANLQDIVANAHPLDVRREAKGRLERFTFEDMFGALWRLLKMFFTAPASRQYMSELFGNAPKLTKDMLSYVGYGVYVGQKVDRAGIDDPN